MATKKKSKGVLERIGDVATSAAEVVIDAGSKAVHAVGDMMPSKAPKKSPNKSSRTSTLPARKASATKKTGNAKHAKPVAKKATPTKATKSKAASSVKPKRSAKR